ncbi:MAG: class I SAM-dependent methyltransferase [Ignavibacteria bacterium]
MNVFLNPEVALSYDHYYETEEGQMVDILEKQVISSFVEKIPGGRVLEVGCGTGHWTKYLVDSLKFSEIIAIDTSEAMLEIARRKITDKVRFDLADAEKLSFNNNDFDVVVAITVMEFVSNIPSAFGEIYRVLRPGGHFVGGFLNQNSMLGKHKDESEIFRTAHFFTETELDSYLSKFGQPILKQCVHYSDDYKILDGTPLASKYQGAFIGVFVKKIN